MNREDGFYLNRSCKPLLTPCCNKGRFLLQTRHTPDLPFGGPQKGLMFLSLCIHPNPLVPVQKVHFPYRSHDSNWSIILCSLDRSVTKSYINHQHHNHSHLSREHGGNMFFQNSNAKPDDCKPQKRRTPQRKLTPPLKPEILRSNVNS